MKKPSVIFECDQDWDAMKPTACGRFCEVCKKNVVDLSHKGPSEIKQVLAGNSELCGMLLREQLEPGLHPLELNFLSKMRYAAAFLATFLGLELATSKAQDKKEQNVEVVNNDKKSTATSTQNENVAAEDENGEPVTALQPSAPVRRSPKRKVYLSKRFPFIHIKKRHFKGRIKF